MVQCCSATIWCLKLDVLTGHIMKVKKNFTSLVIVKFFMALCWLLLAKCKNSMNCTIEKTTTTISAKLKKLWLHVS